jgi:RNA polymerase sigma-70 factor (ECF subfamily)
LWSSILSDPERNSLRRRQRLEQLLTLYWRPVYRYIRLAWKTSVEDAKDLTQSFFAHLLEDDVVGKYRRAQGKFRSFLKGVLRLFLAEEYRSTKRIKRGGRSAFVSLERAEGEPESLVKDPEGLDPEQAYDREWAAGIMSECLAALRRELIQEGKESVFKVYEAYDLARGDRPTYVDLARSLDQTLPQVRHGLVIARARLRALISARLREYVTTPEELQEEIRELSAIFKR